MTDQPTTPPPPGRREHTLLCGFLDEAHDGPCSDQRTPAAPKPESPLARMAREVAESAAPLVREFVAEMGIRQELARAVPEIEYGVRIGDPKPGTWLGADGVQPRPDLTSALRMIEMRHDGSWTLVARHVARTPWHAAEPPAEHAS